MQALIPGIVKNLLLWAIPGALLQFFGGSARQMGIMMATGLLIGQPDSRTDRCCRTPGPLDYH